MNALVEARDVRMVYPGPRGGECLEALTSISLDVRQGEFVSVIGPSGCGKSTLLHVIGGMRRPSGGMVTVGGRKVVGPQPDQIGFVFQDYTLFPWRTVLTNVEIGLQFRGVGAHQRREAARHYLDLVGLIGFAESYPAQLSGGMQQRVAIARALSMEPDLLLMDEPFGALDEQTRMVLGEEVSRILAETEKTIIFVTHSLSEAVYLSDRVMVMSARPGRIKAVLEVSEERPRSHKFMTSDRFVAARNRLFDLLHNEARDAALQEIVAVDEGT